VILATSAHQAPPRLQVKARRVLNDGERTSLALRRHGAKAEPKMERALRAMWQAMAALVREDEITSTTAPARWEAGVRSAVLAAVETAVAPMLAGSVVAASRHLRSEWSRSTRKIDPQIELDDELIADGWEWGGGGVVSLRTWIEAEAGMLITRISDATLETIRQILYTGYMVESWTPYQMARRIRDHIGLLPAHDAAVETYRQALLDSGRRRPWPTAR